MAANSDVRAARRAAKTAACVARKAAKREEKLAGVALAATPASFSSPSPAQVKVQLKKIGARLAHFRVKLGELTVARLRLLSRRAEAAVGEAPSESAPATDKLESAKRQLKVLRVDAQLAQLEVKAQRFRNKVEELRARKDALAPREAVEEA